MLLGFCWFILDTKNYGIIMGVTWILTTQILQKTCINCRSLFIIFNYLFGCIKDNFGLLQWQGARLWQIAKNIVNTSKKFVWKWNIWKEDYQKFSEYLTSFLMEFVMRSKKGQGLIPIPFSICQICLKVLILWSITWPFLMT